MFEKQISRGIEYLDQDLGPSWVERIDLGILDLWSGYNDVVGQLYGNFWHRFDNLLVAQSLGFCLSDGGEGMCRYKNLTQEWKTKIAQLRVERGREKLMIAH